MYIPIYIYIYAYKYKYNSKLLSKDICFFTCVRTGPEGNEPAPVV